MRISDWSSDVCSSDLFTPQEAMDRLASEMDQVMARMQQADEQAQVYGGCGPRLNEEQDPSAWPGKPHGPAAKLANQKPKGRANASEELIKRWQDPAPEYASENGRE